jgi:hypothetical protein
MQIEVIELELLFYMLPEFEAEAADIWGAENIDNTLQDIGDHLYRGDHIGGNIYKVRLAAKGKGKRGGARIIYAHFYESAAVVLIEAYAKNDKEDLTPDEEKELVEFVRTLDIKGVLEHEQGKIKRIKAKVKVRGGLQPRPAAASAPQSKGKGSGRKKDKGKR